MKRILSLVAVTALLAACADDPVTDVVDPGVDPDPTEEDGALQRGDLKAASFDEGADTLSVQITLDGNDVLQAYDPSGSSGDFALFEYQLSTTDRYFQAAAAESDDGNIVVVVAADGGQFNRFFGGTTITQLNFVTPDGGITNYTGEYIGLLNLGPAANGSAVPGSGSATPFESTVIEGDVFFKADFTDGVVNGAIFNRNINGTGLENSEIVLTAGDIASGGTFSGAVELLDLTNVGDYSGAFGGAGATSAGGSIELNGGAYLLDPLIAGIEDTSFLKEYGVFILNVSP